MLALTAGTLAASLAIPAIAGAGPSARLVYARAPEASSCPDETALRNAVAARLGYDPFFPWAKQTVVVQAWREGGRYRARLQLVDAAGLAHGTRTLTSGQSTCAELFDAAALAISIAMDSLPRNDPEPASSDAPPPAPSAAPPPAPVTAPEPPAPEPPAPAHAEAIQTPPESHLGALVGVDVLGVFGAEPGPTAGLAAIGGVVLPSASLSLELRGDAPGVVDSGAGVGRVRAWSYALALVPCARLGVASLCALGAVGVLYARSEDVTNGRSANGVFATAGARVGGEWPVAGTISLRAHLDGTVDLRSAHLQLGGEDAWRAPLFAVVAGAGVAARFE